MHQYGLSLCQADWHVRETGANYHRIYYIYGGHAKYFQKYRQLELKKGHLYFFPYNRPFEISHDSKHPLHCLWFHVSFLHPVLNPLIEVQVIPKTPLFFLLKSLEAFVKDKEQFRYIGESLMHTLIVMINGIKKFDIIRDERLLKIIRYINEHYSSSISNKYLAGLANLEATYFVRFFKKTFTISPQRYLANIRLQQAFDLLYKKTPVAQTAFKTGFSDAKAFSRFFKKHMGIAPSEYRKSQYRQP